jgi:uncharacterized protein (TIGR03382 family)
VSLSRIARPAVVGAVLFLSAGVLAPRLSQAHFILQDPAAVQSQDVLGSPQKLAPCGGESPAAPSGIVTPYHPGDTINISIDETIFHPGHYRIALAVNDRSELPAEPTVTPGVSTPCGSAPIEDPPVFPVLADGVLTHTEPFSEPQTIQVKLPKDVTCTHCTLQVLEFMSNHPLNNPGGCYYHHCADISIRAAGPSVATSGCSSTGDSAPLLAALAGLVRLVKRRRPAV